MKKLLLILLFLLTLPILSQAQFRLGIGLGSSISTVQSSDHATFGTPQFRVGPYISVLPQYRPLKWLSLNMEVQSSLDGFNNSNSSGLSAKYRFHYIRVAPQIAFFPHRNWSIYGGVYGSQLVADAIKLANSDEWSRNIGTVGSKDWGFSAGIRGYFNRFYVQAAYQHGFLDLTPDFIFFTPDIDGEIWFPTRKNRIIQIGAGIMFGGK